MRVSRSGAASSAARQVVESLESRLLLSANPGSNPATALNVGTLSATPKIFQDFVGTSDTDDFYQFTVAATAKVKVLLNGLTGDADLMLTDAPGNVLYFSDITGLTAESITKFLDPGNYFVDVLALKTSAANYALTFTATPPLATEGGHTLASAINLGSVAGTNRTLNGTLSSTYLDTYYKFTLAGDATVNAVGTGMPAGTSTIDIEDGSGNVVASPDQLYATNINTGLAAGTYYLHLQSQDVISGNFSVAFTVSAAAKPDGAGNTIDTARSLGVLYNKQVLNDQVSSLDLNDFYAFTINATQVVTMTLTGLTGDADMELQTATDVIAISSNSGTTPESIQTSLTPGLYFVNVLMSDDVQANYTLTLTPSIIGSGPPDGAGNTPAAARNIGGLSAAEAFSDFVGPLDTNDYYMFSLNTKSTVTVSLDGMTDNADLQLLSSTSSVLGASNKTGTTAENISQVLNVGTYYVRVYPVSGASTNYTLTLTGTAYDGAGNSLSDAFVVGALNASRTFSDFVGSFDTDDFYKFTLPARANFTSVLNALTDNADLQLLDVNGVVLGSSAVTGALPDSITQTLDPGIYYIRVFSASPAANYTLIMTPAFVDGAGNTLTTAANLNALSGTVALTDWVGTTDPNDYYRFTTAGPTAVTLALTGLAANADLQLLNSAGTVLASSTKTGTAADNIASTLNSGTYYVRVFAVSGASTPYALSLTGAAFDGAGNSLSAAFVVGSLNAARTFNDFVGSSDTDDFYKFTLAAKANFTTTLNGLTDNADLQLLDANGAVLGASTAAGTLPDSIAQTLNAGTYYVRVFSASPAASYALTMAAPFLDGAGNTLATAANLNALSGTVTVNDWVSPTDTNDYYRFTTAAPTAVTLALTGLTADADLQLLNSAGTVLASSTKTGTTADNITSTLSPGTYYARVFPVSGASTTYVLTLTGAVHDGAGNTLATANNTGVLVGSKSFSDSVGTADTLDYYKFTSIINGNISLTLGGLSGAATLSLLDASGKTIATGATLTRPVTAGTTYYALVSSASAFSTYNLSMAGPSVTNAGTLAVGTKTVNGSVSAASPNQVYSFAVGAAASVNLALAGMAAGASVSLNLFNSTGGLIGHTTATVGGAANSVIQSLAAGSYYAVVSSTQTTNYSLSLTIAPPSDNTPAGANVIGTLTGSTFIFHNAVGSTDTNDYYKFTVTASRLVTIALSGLTADSNIQLLASNGTTVVASSAHTGTVNETITSTLAAGTYYVRVYPGGTATTNYTLTVK